MAMIFHNPWGQSGQPFLCPSNRGPMDRFIGVRLERLERKFAFVAQGKRGWLRFARDPPCCRRNACHQPQLPGDREEPRTVADVCLPNHRLQRHDAVLLFYKHMRNKRMQHGRFFSPAVYLETFVSQGTFGRYLCREVCQGVVCLLGQDARELCTASPKSPRDTASPKHVLGEHVLLCIGLCPQGSLCASLHLFLF